MVLAFPLASCSRLVEFLGTATLIGAGVSIGTSTPARAVDWVIEVSSSAPEEPLPLSLLGHYDLSGQLLAYDQKPALAPAMDAVGFSDWRVGVGRWEAGTWLLPSLTDATPCPISIPESAAPPGADDLALIAARDWFSDDGAPVTLTDTEDDGRYQLAYLRSMLDVVDAFGANAFVSIDSMPRALAANRTPERADCSWTFQNRVTNVRPADAAVFAAAATGMVKRIVEGDGSAPARAITHWEVWNEPEFAQFWDPAFEDLAGPLDRFFEMAIQTLAALDAYRSSSSHPNASTLRFGLGSFGTADVAEATLAGFDSAPLPSGFVPLDFISFHAYSDDPLQVVAAIESVAAVAQQTTHYADIELALAEWGPNLGNSAGDPVYAASIQPALHIATVLALGASLGLDRAHRAIFWNFYPNSIRLGLLDHDVDPQPAHRAYELLSRMIAPGAVRVAPVGLADGRLDGGNAAVLVSRGPPGTTRVLFVNRNAGERTAIVRLDGRPGSPSRILRYDDPTGPILEESATGPSLVVPGESLLLAEFDPAPVPGLGPPGRLLLSALLIGGVGSFVRRSRMRSRLRRAL
jgi:hypothetical protein